MCIRDRAYIPYNVADHKDGFFPDINADGTYPVFKVVTKGGNFGGQGVGGACGVAVHAAVQHNNRLFFGFAAAPQVILANEQMCIRDRWTRPRRGGARRCRTAPKWLRRWITGC